MKSIVITGASDGIGAALVLNGRLYRGSHGMAGEIGHTQIDPTGAWWKRKLLGAYAPGVQKSDTGKLELFDPGMNQPPVPQQ